MNRVHPTVTVDLGEFTKRDDILICLRSGKLIKAVFISLLEDDEGGADPEVNVEFKHEGEWCKAAIPLQEISFVATVL